MDSQERADRYIRGEMTPQEEREYLASLRDYLEECEHDDQGADDDDPVETAVDTALMARAMAEEGRRRDERIAGELSAMPDEAVRMLAARISAEPVAAPDESEPASADIPKITRIRRRRWPLAVAAAVAILVMGCGLYIIRCQRYDSLVAENVGYYPSGPGSEYIRGEKETVDLSAIAASIEQGDAEEVIPRLERMWTLSGSDVYNDFTNSRADIGWMLANAYLSEHEKDRALDILLALATEYPPESPFGRRVAELIKRVKEL